MRFILAIAAVMIGILMTGNASIQFAQTSRLPEQLSDQEFWRLITDLSEPSGSYTGDNWITNEASVQDVIPPLKRLAKPNGGTLAWAGAELYVHVALQSRWVHHRYPAAEHARNLMLKALFEMSPSRVDFVANLFSKQRPAGLDATPAQGTDDCFCHCAERRFGKEHRFCKSVLANMDTHLAPPI